MDHTLRNRLLFFGPTAVLGGLSMVLHQYMMANCFDAKGLLITGNLPGKLLWAVGIGFAAYLWWMLRAIGGNGSYADNFPRCLPSGVLMIAGGAVMALAVPELGLTAPWQAALGWGSALSMAALGVYRMQGKKPFFGFAGIICLHDMLMLVNNYRLWSADPQLQDYAYQLLAGVLLMLTAFHRTCCDAGIIQRRKLLFTGLAGVFCCLAALSGEFLRSFYLASGLWAAGCVCSTAVLPPDKEEEAQTQAESAEAGAPEDPKGA